MVIATHVVAEAVEHVDATAIIDGDRGDIRRARREVAGERQASPRPIQPNERAVDNAPEAAVGAARDGSRPPATRQCMGDDERAIAAEHLQRPVQRVGDDEPVAVGPHTARRPPHRFGIAAAAQRPQGGAVPGKPLDAAPPFLFAAGDHEHVAGHGDRIGSIERAGAVAGGVAVRGRRRAEAAHEPAERRVLEHAVVGRIGDEHVVSCVDRQAGGVGPSRRTVGQAPIGDALPRVDVDEHDMALRRIPRDRQQVAAHCDAAEHPGMLARTAASVALAFAAACSQLPLAERGACCDHCVHAEFVVPADGLLELPSSDRTRRIDELALAPPPHGERFLADGRRGFCYPPGSRVTARLRFRTFAVDGAPPATAAQTLPTARRLADAPSP